MSSFYKKGRGRKTAMENQHISQIQRIIDNNDVDMQEYNVASNPNELETLRDELKRDFGLPSIEKQDTSSSQADPEPQTDNTKNSDSAETEFDETESFDQPTETENSDLESTEMNVDEKYSISDFKEIENRHPFSQPFKEEDMFKANRFVEDDADMEPEEIDPTKDMSISSEKPEENDSVEDPWKRRQKISEQPSETSSNVKSPSPSGSTSDQPLSEEEKKKVKLNKSTGKKASKMMAKNVTNLTCGALEGGAKWYGKLPVSEKRLSKLEKSGKLDRHFVVDKETQKTFNHIADEHKDFLDKVIKIDEDQKEDLNEAILLLSEKHDVEVTPESNLLMCLVTIVISLWQVSNEQKKKMDRVISKISDQYVLESQRIAPLEKEVQEKQSTIAQQEEKIRHLEMKVNGSEFDKDKPKKDQETPLKKMQFTSEKRSEERERQVENATNEIESITNDIEGDKRPQKFTKKKLDTNLVKA